MCSEPLSTEKKKLVNVSYLVPSSASRNASKCFGCRWTLNSKNSIHFFECLISKTTPKQTKTVRRHVGSLFADLGEVYKRSLLGSDTDHLWRLHDQLLLLPSHHLWVLLPHDVEHSLQQLWPNGGKVLVSRLITGASPPHRRCSPDRCQPRESCQLAPPPP